MLALLDRQDYFLEKSCILDSGTVASIHAYSNPTDRPARRSSQQRQLVQPEKQPEAQGLLGVQVAWALTGQCSG